MTELYVHLFQTILYASLGLIFGLGIFPSFIRFVQNYKLTQKIREEGLSGGTAKLFNELHAHKAGTPTMGGVVIILAVLSVIVASRVLAYFGIVEQSLLNRGETYLPIATLLCVGILGVIDDYLNITESSSQKGLPAKVKMWSLLLFAVAGALWFSFKLEWSILHIPGIGDFDIGLWYAPLFVFVLVGTSNAVNLTDGLDGLAGGLLTIAYGVFGVIAYFYGLPILAALCFVIVAAIVAFLWFNVPPARIYMGDTGSLALGATLGVIAMLTNAVPVLIIVGGIFILETISVILQLFWKKNFKRKLFLIAPIHHHFEAKGWSETQIVMRFWIMGTVMGAFGLLVGLLGMGENGISFGVNQPTYEIEATDLTANKYYVIEDPELCPVIRFACGEGTFPFTDDIGCGCQRKGQVLYFQQRKYFTSDALQCENIPSVCDTGEQYFLDETGCGCEAKY